MVTTLNFETLQAAWEGINLHLATSTKKFLPGGGGAFGNEFIGYNTMVTVNSPWVDPDFDFAKVLGYTDKKWITLVRNYVDLNYLDILRSEITMRREKKSRSYNYSFHFSNKYGGGKDCLLTLVFSKRADEPFPTVTFTVRTSEATSRLLFDFLLVQRIVEYVYGKDQPVGVMFYAPSMFITAERFVMFAHWWGWDDIDERLDNSPFAEKIRKTYWDFKTTPPEEIAYQVNKRCAMTIQGVGSKVAKTLLASTLDITYLVPEFDPNLKLSEARKLRKNIKTIV